MIDFDTLNNLFETKKDFHKMFTTYGDDAIRYALLRSLDNSNIKEFLKNKIDTSDTKKILCNAYNSDVTIDDIVKFIMSKKEDILQVRKMNEKFLISIVEDMDVVNCGIRNDQVDDIIKPFVRNKEFTSLDDMTSELDNKLLPRIRNYVYWSYFNQLSNDLIENSFYMHPSIIPTLRKIHDIDFFIKIEDKIIPFDLKITHISDDFFNTYSEGLNESNKDDSFETIGNESELKKIKDIYKNAKNSFNLPNYGGLGKLEMLEILKEQNNDEINDEMELIYKNRLNMVNEISKNIKPLEWWNYKFQGERLFSNNNRFFVFLTHKRVFRDGKDLKKDVNDIRDSITRKLDTLTLSDIHEIKYIYEKDQKVNGNYTINCVSILVAKE
ncbi:hypothetical protein EGW03_04865 [bacterium]|nr:hypothetical protein [bacterium]